MPEMDGITASRAVKMELRDQAPYIIACTADLQYDTRTACAQAGIDNYLEKVRPLYQPCAQPVVPCLLEAAVPGVFLLTPDHSSIVQPIKLKDLAKVLEAAATHRLRRQGAADRAGL